MRNNEKNIFVGKKRRFESDDEKIKNFSYVNKKTEINLNNNVIIDQQEKNLNLRENYRSESPPIRKKPSSSLENQQNYVNNIIKSDKINKNEEYEVPHKKTIIESKNLRNDKKNFTEKSNNNFNQSKQYYSQNKNNQNFFHQGEKHEKAVIDYSNLLHLPIMQYKEKIMELLSTEQVVIISGTTGCGKTTQVPKFIYERLLKDKNQKKILITQPRRIAAVSIARRLSQELNTRVGETVGYHVGLMPNYHQNTRIIFCTTGIFLQKIINESNLDEFGYIIIDEVHERDIDIDILLVILKHILRKNKDCKLILMSATISTTLFSNYFSNDSIENIEKEDMYKILGIENEEKEVNMKDIWINYNNFHSNYKVKIEEERRKNNYNPAKIINIEQKILPVDLYYYENILIHLKEIYKSSEFGMYNKFLTNQISFMKNSPSINENLFDLAYLIILSIILRKAADDKNNSILVFLPGVFEIQKLENLINSNISKYHNYLLDNYKIHQLHSSISDEQQQEIFEMSKKRKIIIATNIAESSITIPDTKYVIDFCLVKELQYSVRSDSESLELAWSSKSSCEQRKGRAGRTTHGLCFRLVTEKFFNMEFPKDNCAEILRAPLEKTILRLKLWGKYEPIEILGRAIEPPNLRFVNYAINNLQSYGALTLKDKNSSSGKLTKLGKIYSNLPLDIPYSRLIILGYVFDLLDIAIIMACIASQERSIFAKMNSLEQYNKKFYYSMGAECDFIISYNAFIEWFVKYNNEYTFGEKNQIQNKVINEEKNFADELKLNYNVLKEVKMQIFDILKRINKQFCIDKKTTFDMKKLILENDINKIDNNLFFVKVIIAGAFYGKIMNATYRNYENIKKRLDGENMNTKKINTDSSGDSESEKENSESLLNAIKNSKKNKYNLETKKTLVLSIPDQLKIKADDDILIIELLKKIFNGNIRITTVNRYEELLFEINTEEYKVDHFTYRHAITKILNMSSNYRINDRIFSVVKDGYEIKLKKPDYAYEVKLKDIFQGNEVENEISSINHAIIAPELKNLDKIFYVTDSYYNKNLRFYARKSCKLPEYPMIDKLLILIFTPNADFYPNDEFNGYGSFKPFGTSNEISLNYTFSSHDVNKINKIRSIINTIIEEQDENKLNNHRSILMKKTSNILTEVRYKLITNNNYWRIFKEYFPEDFEKRLSSFQKPNLSNDEEDEEHISFLKPKSIKDEKNDQIKIDEYKENEFFEDNEIKNEYEFNIGDNKKNNSLKNSQNNLHTLLKSLNLLDIKEDIRLQTEQGRNELKNEKKLFRKMRKKLFKEMTHFKELFYQDDARVCCKFCTEKEQFLCTVQSISCYKNIIYRMNGYVSPFIKDLQIQDVPRYNALEKCNNFLKRNPEIESEFMNFISCSNNENHVIGFRCKDHSVYLTIFSDVHVVLPCGKTIEFGEVIKLLSNNKKEYDLKLNNSLKIWEKKIKDSARCLLCDEKFDPNLKIKKLDEIRCHHFDKNNMHKELYKELAEEDFE